MELESTEALAQQLVAEMAPFCERIEIAGSIRRQKPEVKDIEIVAIPCWEERAGASNLFGQETLQVSLLHEWATGPACPVQWIKPGTSELELWDIHAAGRYWRGLLPKGIKLDLFLPTAENWGAIYLIRTGSAEFSYAVATHAKSMARPFVDGHLTIEGEPVATPEEQDVFDLLGLKWIAPQQRTGWQAVRLLPKAPKGEGPAEAEDGQPDPDEVSDRFIWRAGDIEIIKSGQQGEE